MAVEFELRDLVEELTPDQAESAVFKILDRLGVPTTNWKPDAVVRVVISAFAVLFSYATFVIAGIAQMGFLSLARARWLTLLARYRYGLERIEASFAEGEVTFANASASAYAIAANDMVVSATNGAEYRVGAAFTIPAGGTVTVPVIAVESGAASSASAGNITSCVTPLPGVTVSNALQLGGLDDETDEELRARCQASTASLSPFGPRDSYRYWAQSSKRADGSTIQVDKVRTVADGMGRIDIYVAAEAGLLVSDDLAVIDANIQRNATPQGVRAITQNATRYNISLTYTAAVYDTVNLSTDAIKSAIADSIYARMLRLPIGGDVLVEGEAGHLYYDSIQTAISDALPQIFHTTLSVFSNGQPLAPSDFVVVTAVTGTITTVPAPGSRYG